MSDKKWCDWSDLMKGKVGEAEHPLSKPVNVGPILKKGEVPVRPKDEEITKVILEGMENKGFRQATDEELFGGLVVTEEELKKMEEEWHNRINGWYKDVAKPVEKNPDLNKSWGNRGPISKETLTEEEERIRKIPVDPSLLTDE